MFNLILDTGFIPEAWSKGTILPIYKNKGDIKDPDNYRGITILSCFGKLFTAILNHRLNKYLESTGLLIEEQAGSRKHYSTADNIFSLKMLVDFFTYIRRNVYIVLLLITVKPLTLLTELLFGENYYVIILTAKFSKLFLTFTIMQSLVLKQAGIFQCFSVVCLVFAKVKICPQSCSRCS